MLKALRNHDLLTQEILDRFAEIGRDENTPFEEKLVICKFFNPYGRWTYYATEFDPEDRIFFGYCVSNLGADCDEWGYQSLDEIEETGVRMGGYLLPFERDCYFEEQKFKDIKELQR